MLIVRVLMAISLSFIACSPCLAETSEQERGAKIVQLYADPVAFTPYPGQGLNAGLLLGSGVVLEAASTTGRSCTEEQCQFETRLDEARIKLFPANSLYLNFGIAREVGTWNHGVAWGHTEEENADYTAEVSTVGGVFALGNMWQLRAVTIGCDWFGFYLPSNVTKTRFSHGPGYTLASKDNDEKKARDLAMGIHLHLVRFHIGVAI